jgi:hypothetical protein
MEGLENQLEKIAEEATDNNEEFTLLEAYYFPNSKTDRTDRNYLEFVNQNLDDYNARVKQGEDKYVAKINALYNSIYNAIKQSHKDLNEE